GAFRPAAWALALAGRLHDEPVVLLPAAPDGRDLAPRLAHAMDRPLLAGAVALRDDRATLVRYGGLLMQDVTVDGRIVATLQPGVRGVARDELTSQPTEVEPERLELPEAHDPEVLELLSADPETIDLAEAPRVVAGGYGLGSAEAFADLAGVARLLGASLGATRVATDAGWAPFERQIGTTGVAIDPELYIAMGISGAVQHTAGLGQPGHIVSVNLDPSCPMMEMADLAIVTDARALLAELRASLEQEPADA
ncbi:MAG: mycofactocin-associated electron transfer flavoprotein alpha subunit, partial [Actinomycetota bacterium]|nr:mycofactocin-associated electron transfer flavoprotein alpha subunit [Actinomycetota bacterium]